MFNGPKPHAGGTITAGRATVKIDGKPAARVRDMAACKGLPGAVALGGLTALIGE